MSKSREEFLHDQLYQKLVAEQEAYKKFLFSLPAQTALECNANEYVIREDVLMNFESLALTEQQMKVLLNSNTPLADVAEKVYDFDSSDLNERICNEIERFADGLVNQEQERNAVLRSVPVLAGTYSENKKSNQVDMWKFSCRLNEELVGDILTEHSLAVKTTFDGYGYRFDSDSVLADMNEKYGNARVSFVIATSVLACADDGRISQRNVEWARTVPNAVKSARSVNNNYKHFACTSLHKTAIDSLANSQRMMDAKNLSIEFKEKLNAPTEPRKGDEGVQKNHAQENR